MPQTDPETDPDSASTLDAFLEQFDRDQAAGSVRPIRAYLDLFPGADEEIAGHYLQGKDAADPEIGSLDIRDGGLLGPYRIERELGRGGQGEVYLAEDTRLRRKIALKVLTRIGLEAPEDVARFRREAEAASRLDHPGICTVHEAGTWRGVPYIAMQLVAGKPLAQLIEESRLVAGAMGTDGSVETLVLPHDDDPLSGAGTGPDPESVTSSSSVTRVEVQRIVGVIEKAARALHAAHEVGIVHRDIKPGNIMVSPSGEPVILDFGLARLDEADGDPALTRTGEVFGSPAYMSPEQLTGRRGDLDQRTDVWSLGVTLFECLTLQRPFQAPTHQALFQSILTRDPPAARKLNARVSGELEVVVKTALEKDVVRRYATAEEFAEDLRRVRSYEPIRAKPVTRWIRIRRWAQRNPATAASLTLAFLFLTAGLVASLVLMQEARAAEQEQGRALTQKTRALAREEKALAERSEALNQFRQMADVAKVEELAAREKQLWPRREEVVPAMDDWLGESRELVARLDAHQRAIVELEQRAHDQTGEDRQADTLKRRERYAALFQEIDRRRDALENLTAQLAKAASPQDEEQLMARKEAAQERLSELERDPRLKERLTWHFDDLADAWRHQVLSGLVKDLSSLGGILEDVEQRRTFALDVRKRTVTGDEPQRLWAACCADVASSEKYSREKRLTLTLQVGLVPLGKDRDSGLWEFWHRGSGERPDRRGDLLSGKVELQEASGIVLVLVPGGRFWMGAQNGDPGGPNHDPQAQRNEGPVHEVSLDAYFISKFELTQGQWSRIMRERPWPSRYGKGFRMPRMERAVNLRHPVESVSRVDCTEALRRWGLGLPTEAQWAYAARAGTQSPWWCGDDVTAIQGKGNISDAFANSMAPTWPFEKALDDGYGVHAPVGTFPANAFGLHDVLGNVWEWCRDALTGYATPPGPGDGLRASSGRVGVFRGGCFDSTARVARTAYRALGKPHDRSHGLGCRPARVVTP